MAFSPIVIVGVPRSGTTLLRVLLDSHSRILALPETPWVTGAYGGPLSLRQLLQDLAEGPYGAARNVVGIVRADILQAGAVFLEELFKPALAVRGKSIVAFKTPSDIPHLEFLTALLPQARYIHITRDGRDVALSQLAKKGSFFLELRGYSSLSYANVFRRWVEWEQKARTVLYRDGLNVCHLRYEDLIAHPEGELRRMMAFLELPFEPRMLDYAAQSHDYPKWEAGSSDVVQRRGVSDASVGKWQREAKTIEVMHTLKLYDKFLVSLGYPSSGLAPDMSQSLLVSGYGVVRPVLETLSLLARRARPLVRGPVRVLACCFLLLLALQSLIPPFAGLEDADEMIGILLCFGATFSLAMGFAPALLRQGGHAAAVMRIGFAMLAYLVSVGAAALLILGKQPDPRSFLLNTAAILLAGIAAMPSLFKLRSA